MESSGITPSLSTYLKSLSKAPSDAAIDHLVLLLRRRQIIGSRSCALAVAHVYKKVITEDDSLNISQLLNHVRSIGRRLQAAAPNELALGNIARRVLGLIREAQDAPADEEKENAAPATKQKKRVTQPVGIFAGLGKDDEVKDVPIEKIKEDVLEGLDLLLDEVRAADGQVADSALDHIHANETVMTYGSSLTVQRFLLAAAKRRKFTLLQVDGYPNQHRTTHDTTVNGLNVYDDERDSKQRLKSLIVAGITVIVVPDSAIFAVMPKVSKVLLPIHVGFPNGGFVGSAGCGMVAQVANAHRVPVVALGAIYKLSPIHPSDPQLLTQLGDSSALAYHGSRLPDEVELINPTTDYITPDLVNLFVTNIGGHAPSFMYRIIADHYRAEDTDLESEHMIVTSAD